MVNSIFQKWSPHYSRMAGVFQRCSSPPSGLGSIFHPPDLECALATAWLPRRSEEKGHRFSLVCLRHSHLEQSLVRTVFLFPVKFQRYEWQKRGPCSYVSRVLRSTVNTRISHVTFYGYRESDTTRFCLPSTGITSLCYSSCFFSWILWISLRSPCWCGERTEVLYEISLTVAKAKGLPNAKLLELLSWALVRGREFLSPPSLHLFGGELSLRLPIPTFLPFRVEHRGAPRYQSWFSCFL